MSHPYEVVRVRGDAAPLACFHGFLGSPSSWRPIVERMEGPVALARLPGHGLDPWMLERPSFDAVVEAFADALPFDAPTWLAGYSMGARIALGLAVRHPSKVRGAVLVGVQPGLRTEALRRERIAWEESLAARVGALGIADFASEWSALPLFDSQATLPASVRETQRVARVEHTERGVAWSLEALGLGRMPALWDALATCPVPLVFVTGELDTKFTAVAEDAARVARDASTRVVAGAGHNVGLEAPTALTHLVNWARALPRPHVGL